MKMTAILLLLTSLNLQAIEPDFDSMSEAEKQLTGIEKLSEKEKKALADWFNNKLVVQKKEEKKKKAGFENATDEREKITTTLVNYYKNKRGTYYFALENGQVWKQTDGGRLHIKKDSSKTVSIEPKALGSWALQVGENRVVRVKRVK